MRSDILKGETEGPSRRKAHETDQEDSSGEQAFLSPGTISLCGLSETVTAGGDLVGTHGDYARQGDQTSACRLPLSRCTMRGTPADLSQCTGRCAGVTVVYVW